MLLSAKSQCWCPDTAEYHATIQVHCVGLSLDSDSFLYPYSPVACLRGSDIGFFPVDGMALVHTCTAIPFFGHLSSLFVCVLRSISSRFCLFHPHTLCHNHGIGPYTRHLSSSLHTIYPSRARMYGNLYPAYLCLLFLQV